MAIKMRNRTALTRRAVMKSTVATAACTAIGGIAYPSLSFAPGRPQITHGIQSGDVSADSGVIWARADRPARMLVEVATTDTFRDIRRAVFVDALPESDFTAKALLDDLPPGQDIFYRISFQDLSSAVFGESKVGHFRTAPADRRSISFVWSGDTMGQGWGIDLARGGMRSYAAMHRNAPDFFIHCGDNIYADCPIAATRKLPDGTLWRSVVTEEKSKPAETLADYRGNYKYNLLDGNLRAFNAAVPTIALWDNHEVMETWWPGEPLSGKPVDESNTLIFAARARRAFHEFLPVRESLTEPGRVYRKLGYGPLLDLFMLDMRSYRGPDGPHDDRVYRLTADLHYTAAHYYDPNRAAFQDFEPFWEFVSGPLHAGTWTAVTLERTFGPQVAFHKAASATQGDNLAPCYGLQFFGQAMIDGATGALTVTLKDVEDRALWSITLDPASTD